MGRAVPTLLGACFGLLVIIIGVILISSGSPQEIPIWYSPTLCKVTGTSKWISYNLLPGTTCPTTLTANQSTSQEFKLEKDLFSMDGLKYNLVFYRASKQVSIQFKMTDNKGKELFKEGPITLSDAGAFSATTTSKSSTTRATTLAGSQNFLVESEEENNQPAGRKLMKGGRGSSSRGVRSTRSSSYSRYGTRTSVRTTTYGYHSCCITYGSSVYMYRSGYHYRSGYYDTSNPNRNDCRDPTKGCQYEIPKDLVRDEFDKITIYPSSDMEWPLKMTIARLETTDTTEPQFFFSFFTLDPDNATIASYVFLPMGCIIFVGAVAFFFLSKSWFD